ncbi:ATP-binding cassette domain-containing protein [Desulfovibrio piger]|uniref:ATP-binding cassette domain-containing protein n=1 Tax=Desulfovibrio piger TaxID=901 RepID=UPI0026E9685B|nr:ATP-binding cassette domain-containing protein [Desulfovibrio piger]
METQSPLLPGSPLVDIEDLSLFLPGDARQKMILHHIDWHLCRGEHHLLLGHNGAGKTTLMRLMHGLLWPAEGRIVWHTSEGEETSPIAGRAVSALVSPDQQENYQRQRWYITGRELLLTAFEDTPLLYTNTSEQRHAQVEDMARRLRALDLLDRMVPEVSQGQLRLLLLGRALVRQPDLLLLDECSDGLDADHSRRFYEVLDSVREHCTVIMSSHRPEQVPDWCRKTRVIHQGRLLTPGSALPPQEGEYEDISLAGAVTSAPEPSAPLLDVRHTTVFIDGQEILHDVDWTLRKGEHWRIEGENGSGKSTFLRLLAGDEFVAVGGTLVRHLPHHGGETVLLEEIRKGVRLVSDLSQALYGYSITALELVCTGLENTVGVYRDYSKAEQEQARRVMRELGVGHLADRSIRLLSTGQLRRLFLARALMGEPDILLLDEPCSALDEDSRRQYLDLLDQLAARGISLVFVSHFEGDAPSCINRRARMHLGRLEILA